MYFNFVYDLGYHKSEHKQTFEYIEGMIGEVETISCEGPKVCRKQGGKIHKKAMPLPAQDPMPIPVAAPRRYKRYPHSDTEDGVMYQESISFRLVITSIVLQNALSKVIGMIKLNHLRYV